MKYRVGDTNSPEEVLVLSFRHRLWPVDHSSEGPKPGAARDVIHAPDSEVL